MNKKSRGQQKDLAVKSLWSLIKKQKRTAFFLGLVSLFLFAGISGLYAHFNQPSNLDLQASSSRSVIMEEVAIIGPSSTPRPGTYTWNGTHSCGTPPYYYTWYVRRIGDSLPYISQSGTTSFTSGMFIGTVEITFQVIDSVGTYWATKTVTGRTLILDDDRDR